MIVEWLSFGEHLTTIFMSLYNKQCKIWLPIIDLNSAELK